MDILGKKLRDHGNVGEVKTVTFRELIEWGGCSEVLKTVGVGFLDLIMLKRCSMTSVSRDASHSCVMQSVLTWLRVSFNL